MATMDINKKTREQISALCDGELSASDLELAFVGLGSSDGQQAWEVYHRIGDVLRAQAAPDLSPGFSAKLAERLAAESMPVKRPAAVSAVDDGKAGMTAASQP